MGPQIWKPLTVRSGGAAFGSENACLFRLYAFFPCMEGGGSQTARRVERKEVGH